MPLPARQAETGEAVVKHGDEPSPSGQNAETAAGILADKTADAFDAFVKRRALQMQGKSAAHATPPSGAKPMAARLHTLLGTQASVLAHPASAHK